MNESRWLSSSLRLAYFTTALMLVPLSGLVSFEVGAYSAIFSSDADWRLAILGDNPEETPNDPFSEWISISVDSEGAITSGSWKGLDGSSGTVTGGQFNADESGLLSGSLSRTGSYRGPGVLDHFQMTSDGQLFAGVGSAADGDPFIALGIQQGSDYSTEDLAGAWYLYAYYDEPAPSSGSAEWVHGTIEVDGAGLIIGGSGTEMDYIEDSITGGSLTVDAAGAVEMTLSYIDNPDGSYGSIGPFSHLQMHPSKQIIGGVLDGGDDPDAEIILLVKAGGTFSTSDLAGSWVALTYFDDYEGQFAGWAQGQLDLDEAGNILAGRFVASDEPGTTTVTEGTFSIDTNGLIRFDIAYDDGHVEHSDSNRYKLSAAKEVMVGVGETFDDGHNGHFNLMLRIGDSVTPDLSVAVVGDGLVGSDDSVISCPGTCSANYPANTLINLTATPDPGWQFAGWGGACTGFGDCTLTLDESTSVTANFTETTNRYQLDSPVNASLESGIGVVSGWVCEAGTVSIQVDEGAPFEAAYGAVRTDSQTVCGDTANGFAAAINWSDYGNGEHALQLLADSETLTEATVTVTSLGPSYLTGMSLTTRVADFPATGLQTILSWSEPHQNFVVGEAASAVPLAATPLAAAKYHWESPLPGGAESGRALIRGWACAATSLSARLDGLTLEIPYGSTRADTQGVCGDSDNGFALAIDWNDYSEGSHQIELLVDGTTVETRSFSIATPAGQGTVSGVQKRHDLADFPYAGDQLTLQWSEPHQNFRLVAYSPSLTQRESTDWQVAELYIATLGYAPDADGLDYWVEQIDTQDQWTQASVAESFFDQPLVEEQYPADQGDGPFIEALYQYIFGRAVDAEGYAYWLDELQSGRIQRNQMIIALLDGGWDNALSATDMAAFANRVEAGLAFADYQRDVGIHYSTLSAAGQAALREAGQTVLEGIGADDRDLQTVTETISTLLDPLVPDTDRHALSLSLSGTGQGRVTSSPAGIDCGTTCTADFTSGAQVVLTAAPENGSSFEGWGGACSGTASTCTLTLDAAMAATATFSSLALNTLSRQGVTDFNQWWEVGTGTKNVTGSGQVQLYASGQDFNIGTNSSDAIGLSADLRLDALSVGAAGLGLWAGETAEGYVHVNIAIDGTAPTAAYPYVQVRLRDKNDTSQTIRELWSARFSDPVDLSGQSIRLQMAVIGDRVEFSAEGFGSQVWESESPLTPFNSAKWLWVYGNPNASGYADVTFSNVAFLVP